MSTEEKKRIRSGRKMHHGYVMILRPGYHRAQSGHGYVPEHILIAEAALGKPLPWKAEVHHVNGVKSDNRHSNLVICEDRSFHKLLHFRQDILALGGNPDVERYCADCATMKPYASFHRSVHHPFGFYTTCKPCQIAKARLYRQRLRAVRHPDVIIGSLNELADMLIRDPHSEGIGQRIAELLAELHRSLDGKADEDE